MADTSASRSAALPEASRADDQKAAGVAGEWQRVFDLLEEWRRSPGRVDEDDLIWPTEESIDAATRLVEMLRDGGKAVPLRVVPGGDGGISFEYRPEGSCGIYNIDEAGKVERLKFERSKLVERVAVPLTV